MKAQPISIQPVKISDHIIQHICYMYHYKSSNQQHKSLDNKIYINHHQPIAFIDIPALTKPRMQQKTR
jgi:hypothetical protein